MAVKKKTVVIIGGFFVLAIAAVVIAMVVLGTSKPCVMTIDGEKISQEELNFYINRNKALVADYFHKNYDAQVDQGFWERDFSGEQPKDKLLKDATASLRYYKAILSDCKEKKLIDDISFSYFQKSLKVENERRNNAINNGKVIYGNSQYTENNYFDYVVSNLQIKQKELMVEQGLLNPDDTDLIQFYRQIRDQYSEFKSEDGYKDYGDVRNKLILLYKNQKYDEYIMKRVGKQNVVINEEIYRNITIAE